MVQQVLASFQSTLFRLLILLPICMSHGQSNHIGPENVRRRLSRQNSSKKIPTSNTRRIQAGKQNATGDESYFVNYGDSIYLCGDWDGAPVVIEEYKLVFFTVAKVGCTVWKQFFRRVMGLSDWKSETWDTLIPWNPELNGLKYLYDYDRATASKMMMDPEWTRAIFVRDPKERFVSAYFDKVMENDHYVVDNCCPFTRTCTNTAKQAIENFLEIIKFCEDAHWKPLSKRIEEEKYWPYINFVGHMDTVYEDSEKLLRKIGAWEKYGATGWGDRDQYRIFESFSDVLHATHANNKLELALTPELEKELDIFYAMDYNNSFLNLTKHNIFPEDGQKL
jgi:Sulfotransferase family